MQSSIHARTRYLAALGAEVIKVESASRADLSQRNLSWEELNPGKRSITLDLKQERGRELDSAVERWAQRLADGPTAAMGLTKHAVYSGWSLDPDRALEPPRNESTLMHMPLRGWLDKVERPAPRGQAPPVDAAAWEGPWMRRAENGAYPQRGASYFSQVWLPGKLHQHGKRARAMERFLPSARTETSQPARSRRVKEAPLVPAEAELEVAAPRIPTRLRLLRPMPSSADQIARWDYAVTLYRHAVENYVRTLKVRQDRAASRVSRHHQTAVMGVEAPAEPESPAPPRMCDQLLLSRRELQVAALIAQGLSNQQIAAALVIEQGTVANHVAHILRKLDVANRTQIAAWFIANEPPATEAAPPLPR